VPILVGAVYASFRALNLRRALVDRPYRDRALWTAIGGLSAVLFAIALYVDSVFGQTPTTSEGVIVEAAIWGVAFLALLRWIVSNVNVSMSADYFNRDALGWKRGGWVVVIAVFLVGYVLSSLPHWWLPQSFTSGLGNDLVTTVFFLVSGYSALVLVLTYRRIRDMKIKAYTKWAVVTFVSMFAYVAFPNLGTAWLTSITIVPALVFAYCMYQTVGSLAIRTSVLPT
jgi:hypothetical protein